MAQLSIHNIGPIKDIDLLLNRINIFIGPQSSGKSTIAKILSFCQWLEKDCVLRQQSAHVNEEFVKEQFVAYHNISDYLNEESTFYYHGSAIDILYRYPKLRVFPNEGFQEAKVSKNAYIPAERNVLAVPGIFSTKMPKNYLASFIDDWQQIRTKYGNGDHIDILNLGETYYYDDASNADMLSMGNGKTLHLSQASSGLQSVTPLCVYIAYLTDWIYSHAEDKSSDDRKLIWDSAVAKFVFEGVKMPLDYTYSDTNLKDNFKQFSERLLNSPIPVDSDMKAMIKKIRDLSEMLGRPYFTNLVIEEPELNLFPRTQANLIYFILSKIDHTRDNMVITTHSPYILYAINNCILANLMEDKISEEESEELDVPKAAWLNGKSISVWELRDGYVMNLDGERNVTIQDKNGLIRGNYFDRVMHNIMADFNFLMNFN